MERPWLQHYDPSVPQHLDYPRLPLYQLLDDSAARGADRPCASFFGRRLSYRALKEASDRFAAALQRLGLVPGDRVGLLLPTSPPFIVAYYGALKAGAVVVALNPLANLDELTFHLRDSGAETLVTIPMFLDTAIGLRQRAGLRHVIAARLADWRPFALGLAMRPREWRQQRAARAAAAIGLTSMIAQPPPDWRPAPADPDGLAVLLYSGGTTGVAKGIMLSHFACMANAHQIRAWGHLRPRDRILAVLPLFHGYGMSADMNAPLLARAEIVLVPRFEARDVLKTIQKRQPTFFTGVPTMFAAFSSLPAIDRYDLTAWRVSSSARRRSRRLLRRSSSARPAGA
jgi:long-chain acyl-CoA synthetase